MAIERFNLTFSSLMSQQPVLYNLGKKFNLVTIVERGQLSEDGALVQVALRGDADEIQRAIADLNTIGVMISPPGA